MLHPFSDLQGRIPGLEQVLREVRNPDLWRAGGLLAIANVIVVGLGIVRTPLMTWILPKDEVGMLGVLASWMPFVQLLSLSGMDGAAFHFASKGLTGAFRINLNYRLRWSLISALAFFGGALYWAHTGNVQLAWMFLVAGFSYPLTAGLTACTGLLSALEKYSALFWYRIFESLTDFAGFLPLAISVWMISKVVTFYAANQLATAVMMVGVNLALIWYLTQSEALKLSSDEEAELVQYSKHLTVISGISVAQSRSDAFLVGILFPLATIADYSIAVLVQEQIKRLWNIYVTVRYPTLVKIPNQERWGRFLYEGILVWSIFIAAGLIIALIAHWLIPVILPPSYVSSLGYLDILVATVIIGIPGGLTELYFKTYQDAKTQYMMRTIAAVFGVLAPLTLVFFLGAYGAAAGRLVANLVLSILGVAFFTRQSKNR
jgi:O-antigen/teichoic acid export membrane protein